MALKLSRCLLAITIVLLVVVDTECGFLVHLSNHNTSDCGWESKPCKSLSQAVKQVNVNTFAISAVIIALDHQVLIDEDIEFQAIDGITLRGNGSLMKCNGERRVMFKNASNVHLSNFRLENCGKCTNNHSVGAALYFENCANMTLENVTIAQSHSTGIYVYLSFASYGSMIFYNCSLNKNRAGGIHISINSVFATIIMDDCNFTDNRAYWGGGLLMQLHDNAAGNIILRGGHFVGNTAQKENDDSVGSGGAIAIFINGSRDNTIDIETYDFTKNNAIWGGGVFVQFQENATNNSVIIRGGCFAENSARRGGGGVGLGHSSHSPLNNNISVINTAFIGNMAKYGGGSSLYAKHSTLKTSNDKSFMFFINCTWNNNLATFSPSVDISSYTTDTLSRGFLPTIEFTNCTFDSNTVQYGKFQEPYKSTYVNAGSFVITGFSVKFTGNICFSNHQYSALLVISGTIEFTESADIIFVNNTAIKGGAISLYGFSVMYVTNGSSIQFVNNEATDFGGAIFHHSFDQHDFVSTRGCFIRARKGRSDSPLAKLTFLNNKAAIGCSIFTLTLFPCVFSIRGLRKEESLKALSHMATFNFSDNPASYCTPVATAGNNFSYTGSEPRPLRVVPGKDFKLPLEIKDEFDNKHVDQVWRLNLHSEEKIGQDRTYTTKSQLRIYGENGTSGNITVHQVGFREIAIKLPFKLIECPPGYFLGSAESSEAVNTSCVCSSYSKKHSYQGIRRCNSSFFQAYLDSGYWAGYVSGNESDGSYFGEPESLLTALCPLEMCRTSDLVNVSSMLLPENSSKSVLEELICRSDRKGTLCGECKENLTVYYHSPQYKCGEIVNCRYAVLFYFLTEVFPMFTFFTVVIIFNVHFTAGSANGFIFYCQVLDILSINGKGALKIPPLVTKLSVAYKLLYGLFTLDFLNNDSFSFCLWHSANVQDVLSFKYVSTSIAFLLVMLLVLMMRYCCFSAIRKIKRQMSVKESVIHGLTAFLIMSYTQCAKVSFQILTHKNLYGPGEKTIRTVTYYGGIPYFEKAHMLHAVLAIVFLLLVVIAPPFIMIVHYPYLYLLDILGLSENQAFNWPIIKLKPLLDSFYGCFKPRLQIFASIYLLYRIVFLFIYSLAHHLDQFYIIVETVVIIMLGIHSIAQPYKKQSHNIVDSLIFINIALINGITLYLWLSHSQSEVSAIIHTLSFIQLILAYLPLLCVCLYIVRRVTQFKHNISIQRTQDSVRCDEDAEEEETSFITAERSSEYEYM